MFREEISLMISIGVDLSDKCGGGQTWCHRSCQSWSLCFQRTWDYINNIVLAASSESVKFVGGKYNLKPINIKAYSQDMLHVKYMYYTDRLAAERKGID